MPPFKPPFSGWYNANARCDYHVRNPGHPTEHCIAFKDTVQTLINDGKLKFKNLGQPSHLSQGIKPKVLGMVNDQKMKLGFITMGQETEGRKIRYTLIIEKSGEQLSKVARLRADREDEKSKVSELRKEN